MRSNDSFNSLFTGSFIIGEIGEGSLSTSAGSSFSCNTWVIIPSVFPYSSFALSAGLSVNAFLKAVTPV